MSRNKRDNELLKEIEKEVLNNINVSVEVKSLIRKLQGRYVDATYNDWGDRHQWYRDMVDDMVNDTSFEDDKLAEEMANNHPTLQQSFYRMVEKFIRKMGKKTIFVDGRNEASVNICKKLNEVTEKENPYIPYV